MSARRAGANDVETDAGYVLVSMLWLLGLLATAVGAMSLFSAGSLGFVATSADRLRTEALAQAGLEQAFLSMQDADPKSPLCGRAFWRSADGAAEASWIGETSRIDLNAAPPPLLQAMLARLAPDDAIAGDALARILARRAPEKPDAQAGVAAPYQTVAELDLERLPPELVASLRRFVTVFNGGAPIDPRLAPEQVLSWLPEMTEARLRRLLELKAANVADINAWRQEAGGAGAMLTFDAPNAVRIRLDVTLKGSAPISYDIVAKRLAEDVEPYRVLSWRNTRADAGPVDACPGEIR